MSKPAVISSTGTSPVGNHFVRSNRFWWSVVKTTGTSPVEVLLLRLDSFPTDLAPVASMTDYQKKTNVNNKRLHGACPRGYHDWSKIKRIKAE